MKKVKSNQIKSMIKVSGLKKKFIADKLGITQNYLYLIISGQRDSQQMRTKLIDFLSKFITKAA
jgi:predicted XRE-type DNA-binding protein